MTAPQLPEELRAELLALGLTADEIAAADRRGDLDELAWQFVLRGGRDELDLEGVSVAAGVEPEMTRTMLRAAGLRFDDGVHFTQADVRMVQILAVARQVYGDEMALAIMRVMGTALATVADGVSAVVGVTFEPLADTERLRARLAARPTVDGAAEVMSALLRHHVLAARQRANQTRQVTASHDTRTLAVGFVDLVGFTPTSAGLDLAELVELVDRFEARAVDILTAFDGRLVKFIGDEVMFVVVEPADAVEATLRLVEALASGLDSVAVHAGLAAGRVLTRGGDFYGPIVNLAARAADVAVPGEVLVTDGVQRSVGGVPTFAFRAAGRRMLKGFAEPVELWSVSRAEG